MSAGHTAGPWSFLTDGPEALPEVTPNYSSVRAGHGFFGDDGHGFNLTGYMSEADGRLIAAAPDLLAALKCFVADERFVVSVGGNPIVVEKMIEDARAVIEKAEGKAP